MRFQVIINEKSFQFCFLYKKALNINQNKSINYYNKYSSNQIINTNNYKTIGNSLDDSIS